MSLFAFGSKGSGPGCFVGPRDVTFGPDGLVYETDGGNSSVCVWSKEGNFRKILGPHIPQPALLLLVTTINFVDHFILLPHCNGVHIGRSRLMSLEEEVLTLRGFINLLGYVLMTVELCTYVADYFHRRMQVF